MMKLARSFFYVILLTLISMVSTNVASAQFENYLQWEEKLNVSPYHNWNINFNDELNETTVNNNNIYVKYNSENVKGINPVLNADKKSVTVLAPAEGYQAGEVYYLYIEASVKSVGDKDLKQPIKMKFTIQDNPTTNHSMILDKFIPGLNWEMDQIQTENLMNTLDNVEFEFYVGEDNLEADYLIEDIYSINESSWLYIFFNKDKQIDFFNFADSTTIFLIGEELNAFNEDYVNILSGKIGMEPTSRVMNEVFIGTTWETRYERLDLYIHTSNTDDKNPIIFTIRKK